MKTVFLCFKLNTLPFNFWFSKQINRFERTSRAQSFYLVSPKNFYFRNEQNIWSAEWVQSEGS